MQKYRHLELEKDEHGHILNQCPYKKTHKNGAIIYVGGLSCIQCKLYHGIDDDGLTVCGYGTDNVSKKKNDTNYNQENNEKNTL